MYNENDEKIDKYMIILDEWMKWYVILPIMSILHTSSSVNSHVDLCTVSKLSYLSSIDVSLYIDLR